MKPEPIDFTRYTFKLPLSDDRLIVKAIAGFVDEAADNDDADARIKYSSYFIADRLRSQGIDFATIEREIRTLWPTVRNALQVYRLEAIPQPGGNANVSPFPLARHKVLVASAVAILETAADEVTAASQMTEMMGRIDQMLIGIGFDEEARDRQLLQFFKEVADQCPFFDVEQVTPPVA